MDLTVQVPISFTLEHPQAIEGDGPDYETGDPKIDRDVAEAVQGNVQWLVQSGTEAEFLRRVIELQERVAQQSGDGIVRDKEITCAIFRAMSGYLRQRGWRVTP